MHYKPDHSKPDGYSPAWCCWCMINMKTQHLLIKTDLNVSNLPVGPPTVQVNCTWLPCTLATYLRSNTAKGAMQVEIKQMQVSMWHVALALNATFILRSLPHPYLIASSMQIQRKKAWEILSCEQQPKHSQSSVRQRGLCAWLVLFLENVLPLQALDLI